MCLPVFKQQSSGPEIQFPTDRRCHKMPYRSPHQILGQTLAATQHSTGRAASAKLKTIVTEGLKKIDSRPIWGEMKLWILCNYLIPSTCFHLMVNQTLASTISVLEGTITKYIKKWLKLPRNATRAIIHHPSVVKTPCLDLSKWEHNSPCTLPSAGPLTPQWWIWTKFWMILLFFGETMSTKKLRTCSEKLTKGSQQNHCRQPSGSWCWTRRKQSGTRGCKACRSRANSPTFHWQRNLTDSRNVHWAQRTQWKEYIT